MKTPHALMATLTAGMLCLGLGLSGCKPEATERTVIEEQVDQELAQLVKVTLGNSPSFRFPDVQVASFKGQIQLSGFVRSDDQKRAAETIAKGIPGVAKVENGIALK